MIFPKLFKHFLFRSYEYVLIEGDFVGEGAITWVGLEVGEIVGDDDGPAIVKDKLLVTTVPSKSSKLTSNVRVPDSVGTPEIHPSDVSSSPANSEPAFNDQV